MESKIFFLGFNKTGTRSINSLFLNNGFSTIHWIHEESGDNIARRIKQNCEMGRPAISGFDEFQVFSDLTYVTKDEVIEGNQFYSQLKSDYPDSLFVLNIRDKDKWLLSRTRHSDFAERYQLALSLNFNELIDYWSKLWETRNKEIQSFFVNDPNFLTFNIDKDWKDLFEFLNTHKIFLEDLKVPTIR